MNRRDRKTAERWIRSQKKTSVIISTDFFNGGGLDKILLKSLHKDFHLWPGDKGGIVAIWRDNPDVDLTVKDGFVVGYIKKGTNVFLLGGNNFSCIVHWNKLL
jgi:hypothetical protein